MNRAQRFSTLDAWRARAFFVATLMALLVGALMPGSALARAAAGQPSEAADAEITVELLLQSIQPNKPLLVRVTVRAERAISGELDLVPGVNEWGNPIRIDNEYRWDIDVAANTEVQTLALIPVSWDSDSVEARLIADGEVIATQKKSFNVGMGDNREQIGTLGIESQARVKLVGANRDAAVTKLDGLELFGASLDAFSTIVADPTALAALDEAQRAVVAGWIIDGGQLALPDGVDDLETAGLSELEAFRSGPLVGQGVIVALGGAQELSNDVVLSNGTGTNQQMFFGPNVWSDPVASIGQRSGLQLASIRSLAIFLAVYALVAGPLAYGVAQRLHRPRLLWMILPATALIFTGVAALTGSAIRSSGHDEHTTIIMSRPSGSQAKSYLLVRGGEEISVDRNWWVSSTQADMIQQGPGSLRFNVGAEKTTASVGVASGSAALLTASGPAPSGDAALQLVVAASEANTISGTVTNNLAVDLFDAIVVWDGASVDIDSLAAGETREFSLEYAQRATNPWGEPGPGPEQTKWGVVAPLQRGGDMVMMAEGGFIEGPVAMPVAGGDVGEPPDGSRADGNLWTLWRADRASIFSRSQVVAIGWTDELPSPTAAIDSGRTAFVAAIPTKSADTPAFRTVTVTPENEMFMASDMNGEGPPMFQVKHRVDFAEPIVAKDWGVRVERNTAGIAFDVDGETRWVRFEEDDDGAVTVSLPDELDGATSIFTTTSVSAEGPMGIANAQGTLAYRDPDAVSRKLNVGDDPFTREVPFMPGGMSQPSGESVDVPPLTIGEPFTTSGVVEPGFANSYTLELNQNAAITVTMVGVDGEIDPRLTVATSQGNDVESNDDSGGSTNSSLDFTAAEPGRYEIFATTVAGPGAYELSITLNDAGEAPDAVEQVPTPANGVEPGPTDPPAPEPVPTESVDG